MKYGNINGLSIPVSKIIYGTACSPFFEGGDGSALLDEAIRQGINTFDMARVYQSAEKSVGNWLEKRQNREKVVLLSKCGHHDALGHKRVNRTEMNKDLAQTLEDLKTDYIDIYLLHRDDMEVEVGDIVEIFNEMLSKGKIRCFGGSNWTHERIEAANEYAEKHHLVPFAVSSPNFGLAEQFQDPWGGNCITISGVSNQKARDWYQKNNMPVVAYSSLGRGLFSGKVKSDNPDGAKLIMDSFAQKGYLYPENLLRLKRCEELAEKKQVSVPQIAMAWIFQQNLDTYAVVGTTKHSRIQENVEALSIPLSPEECRYLNLE